ncbi:hypothetical protein [Agromyces kandeliae]|uniref:Uncharacterized protein n=1 Tax=Agromyces kandeliae TaxID=2666141 RepID=A0A6L5R2Y6_9MICO|nr:hypothetical protein [Agromyces kandeliae]MRX43397.1 hypothetical protein [Agromyces kandeliae]
MTHDGGTTDDERRLERRRSRLGVLGIALFVGGPVLGAGLAVVGVVVGLREDPRWALLAVLGLGVGFASTFAGLRMLTRLEQARSVGTSPTGDAPFGEPSEPTDPMAGDVPRPGAGPDQPDSASPGRTGPEP